MWNGFVGFWFFGIRYLQQYIFVHYSNVSYVIQMFYMSWICLFIEKHYVFTIFFFDCAKFSYDTLHGSIFLVLLNNLFLCGLLPLSIISFENEFFYPFICLFLCIIKLVILNCPIQYQNCWMVKIIYNFVYLFCINFLFHINDFRWIIINLKFKFLFLKGFK